MFLPAYRYCGSPFLQSFSNLLYISIRSGKSSIELPSEMVCNNGVAFFPINVLFHLHAQLQTILARRRPDLGQQPKQVEDSSDLEAALNDLQVSLGTQAAAAAAVSQLPCCVLLNSHGLSCINFQDVQS